MNVSLPAAMKIWVESRVRCGQFANASDYVRDLIRRDQIEVEKLELLRAAIDSGRASGRSSRGLDEIKREAQKRARATGYEG